MDAISTAKLMAIPSAFLLGGYHFALTHNTMPILKNLPIALAAPAFERAYMSALQQIFLPLGAISIASFSYLALAKTDHTTNDTTQRILYGTAGVLVLGIGLVTKFIMVPGVERLLDMNKDITMTQGKAGIEEEVKSLFQAFTRQNRLRFVLGMAAGMVGLCAGMVSEGDIAR